MTGPQLLIVAVIVVFVIAFVITMIMLYAHAKQMMSTNTKLLESQNALLEQNELRESKLEKRIDELEVQLKQHIEDEVTLLQEQTRQHREQIELTANMSDEDLMAWQGNRRKTTLHRQQLDTEDNGNKTWTHAKAVRCFVQRQREIQQFGRLSERETFSVGLPPAARKTQLDHRSRWKRGRIRRTPDVSGRSEASTRHHALAISAEHGKHG